MDNFVKNKGPSAHMVVFTVNLGFFFLRQSVVGVSISGLLASESQGEDGISNDNMGFAVVDIMFKAGFSLY